MLILGIETSCDETSAAIIHATSKKKKVRILSNVTASSITLHAKTGGITPEIAAREQIKYILPVISDAFKKAGMSIKNPMIDYIAVTKGPGLIGSLLVGVETAKTLSAVWDKPIVSVNHLIGHIYANFIEQQQTDRNISFPAIGLIVSGGHTDLVLIRRHRSIEWIGGTRDDAGGEALDKIGRILGLAYPGGPEIEKIAKSGDSKSFNFPRALLGSSDFDFSFSGVKTAVFRLVQSIKLDGESRANICASIQEAIFDVLVKKTLKAAEKFSAKSILLGGGVAANQTLKDKLILNSKYQIPNRQIFVPQKFLCTDNAAMIATASFYNYKEEKLTSINANPSLFF